MDGHNFNHQFWFIKVVVEFVKNKYFNLNLYIYSLTYFEIFYIKIVFIIMILNATVNNNCYFWIL